MGAGNVKIVYAKWGSLPDGPFRVLVYMALVALDNDDPPRFYAGREALAFSLGRVVTDAQTNDPAQILERRNAFKAVDRMLDALKTAGAIFVLVPHAPKRHAEYGLRLAAGRQTPVNGDSTDPVDRGLSNQQSPVSGKNSPRSAGQQSPVTDQTVPGDRGLQEYEEQARSSRSTRGRSADPSTEQAKAAAIVIEHTDATANEALAVVDTLHRERPDIRNVAAVLRHFTAEEINERVDAIRDSDRRHSVREFLDWAATQPECDDGEAGGDLLRPDNQLPNCPRCRARKLADR